MCGKLAASQTLVDNNCCYNIRCLLCRIMMKKYCKSKEEKTILQGDTKMENALDEKEDKGDIELEEKKTEIT